MSSLKRILFWIVGLFPAWAGAQSPSFTTEDYYLFPINPGQTHYLAGTMGEMRGTHFHGGIDIRTGGRTGLKVLATADGYISRMRVQRGGYGHCLYVQHPNGTTSVYAHLEKFEPELEAYLLTQQYDKRSYEVNLFPDKDQFPFRQGELIGYSGNTGSSSGPHLHFEIRDSKQRVLDPLKFNFSEIRDNIAPTLRKVAFVCLEEDARINGAFGRYEFEVILNDGKYRITKPLELEGRIGVEIDYIDRHNGSSARNGIPEIVMALDNDTLFHQRKTRMSFGSMRNIVVHLDYQTYVNRRRKFNKLFRDEGNTLDIYLKDNKGITFDGTPKDLNIYLKDAYGNISVLEKTVNNRKVVNREEPNFSKYVTHRKWLHLKSGLNESVSLSIDQDSIPLQPYYQTSAQQYYLWDLGKGLPDFARIASDTLSFHYQELIPSGQKRSLDYEDLQLYLKADVLFDTLFLSYEKQETARSEFWEFHHSDFPLRKSMKITLKPKKTYEENTHVYSVWKNKRSFVGGEWKDGRISFYSRDLGRFTIEADQHPPTVRTLKMDRNGITLLIDDAKSGIKSYNAYLNGEWLLMSYDAKKKKLTARPRNTDQPLEGDFRIEILDRAGNERIYEKQIPTT